MIRCSTGTRAQRRSSSSISRTIFRGRRRMRSRPTIAARRQWSTGCRRCCRIARNGSTRSSGRQGSAPRRTVAARPRPTVSSCSRIRRISWPARRSGSSASGSGRVTIPRTWRSSLESTPPCCPCWWDCPNRVSHASHHSARGSWSGRASGLLWPICASATIQSTFGSTTCARRSDDPRGGSRRTSSTCSRRLDAPPSPTSAGSPGVCRAATSTSCGSTHPTSRSLPGAAPTRRLPDCGRSGSKLGWATPSMSSTHPVTRRTDPPTSTTSSPSSRWPVSTPTRRRSRRGFVPSYSQGRSPGPASCCRPFTGSRAGSGIASSCSESTRGCSRTA